MNESITPIEPEETEYFPSEQTKFIESITSREVLSAFEATGLTFNDFVMNRFHEAGDFNRRYGNGFSALSRYFLNTLAESPNSLSRMQKIFKDIEEPDYYDVDTAEQARAAQDVIVRQMQLKLQRVSTARFTDPARYLSTLILQVCRVEEASLQDSTENCMLWPDKNNARDGSCKDTETYYTNALGFPDGRLFDEQKLSLERTPSGEPLLLVKTNFGVDTALTLRTLVFDGVELAAGHVVKFTKKTDGTFYIRPLRATAFSFSTDCMLDAFGSQAAEVEQATSDLPNRTKPSFLELHRAGWLNRVDELFGTSCGTKTANHSEIPVGI